jgi:hypothetical protein
MRSRLHALTAENADAMDVMLSGLNNARKVDGRLTRVPNKWLTVRVGHETLCFHPLKKARMHIVHRSRT